MTPTNLPDRSGVREILDAYLSDRWDNALPSRKNALLLQAEQLLNKLIEKATVEARIDECKNAIATWGLFEHFTTSADKRINQLTANKQQGDRDE